MEQTRRGFLGAVGAAAAATAGCMAPASDPGGTQRFERAYESVSGAVARVRTYTDAGGGQGSAFRVDGGHLVTNEHVIAAANRVSVQYADGAWRDAEVVGADPYSDLAVLRAESPPPGPELPLREDLPNVGAEVLVVGAPFGLDGSATAGIVSGRNRTIPAPNDFSVPDVVQVDAPLNPGNSGGPIVDLDGNAVAVATARVPGADNLGFGVSSRLARRVVPRLVEAGSYDHAYMGVGVAGVDPAIAAANDLPEARGVYVVSVVDGGPADGTLRGSTGEATVEGMPVPTGGDTIVGLDGVGIATRADLSRHLALETSPGDDLEARVLRDGSEETVSFALDERPAPN
ncbi:S1C family serine protease [Haloparvum sedimenti]|uniref:S1C family serine protease n=1 Tax=Haloparvum sedimenti TaxID=1678448 RepID=UPI00071E8D8E|nr:trypsin-like peptidase domain-containing protein [Haloparvum sedimenti]